MSRGKTVGFRSERGPVLLALMVTTGLVAIDATILATAVPSIVRDLGGFSQFPWLFSMYLLTQAVSVPIYAKLSDTIGRKPVILIGIALFLAGSIACGFAWNMASLIAFRALQGLGAGAVQPMAMTIVGDIYTVAERAKVQGYIASVWAVCSILGPTLGGLLSQFASWRWIFFVNVPLCLIAGWILIRRYHEQVHRTRQRIDVVGAVVLTLGLTAVILGLLEGGHAWAWISPPSLIAFGVGIAALVVFVFVERRAAEPILDLQLLRRRVVVAPMLIGMCIGALLTGIASFSPTYLQNSIGAPPLVAGVAVAALSLGWPISASTSGSLYLRWGFRRTVIIGSSITLAGLVALVAVTPWPNPWSIAAVTFVTGFGLGWTGTPALIAAQSSVEWEERGVVTGLNMFARSAGAAVGVAVFGAIANAIISSGAGETDFDTIVSATTWVFAAAALVGVLTLAAALAMPRDGAGRAG